MKKFYLVGLMILILVLAAGCGSSKTVQIGDGKDKVQVKSDGKDKSVTMTDDKGNKMEIAGDEKKSLDIPEGYPKDALPIISGGKIKMANKSTDNGKTLYSLSVWTDKDFNDVKKYYQDIVSGLTDKSEMMSSDNSYIGGGKKGEWEINVLIGSDTGDKQLKTMAQLTVSKNGN